MFKCVAALLFFLLLQVSCIVGQQASKSQALPYLSDSLDLDMPSKEKPDNLFKKLLEAIKFKQHAKTREKKRVLEIIENTGLPGILESLDSSLKNLDQNINGISDRISGYDFNMIDSLRIQIDKLRQDVISNTNKEEPTGYVDPRLKDPVENFDLAGNTESDIETMINNVISARDAMKKLAKIRVVLNAAENKEQDSKNGFSIKLINKAEVIAYYPAINTFNDFQLSGQQLAIYSTLSFYGIGFNYHTGQLDAVNSAMWNLSYNLLRKEKYNGRIELSVINTDTKQLASFLKNDNAQENLIQDIVQNLNSKGEGALGVNINFENLTSGLKVLYAGFIKSLSATLRANNLAYRLSVTVPAVDPKEAYAISMLDPYVDRFILDFSKIPQDAEYGPLAPLAGKYENSIKACLNRILAPGIGIIPSKLIVCIPYYGIYWNLKPQTSKSTIGLTELLSYKKIQANFSEAEMPDYHPVSSTASFYLKNDTGLDDTSGIIWFDNDITLGNKYDFLLQAGIGGVAIKSLGNDKSYSELWEVVAEKFITIDTTYIDTTLKQQPLKERWLWKAAYLGAKYEQIEFLFAYPCEVTYPKVLVNKWEKALVYKNRMQVKKGATRLFLVISLVLFLVFLGFIYFYVHKLKMADEKWLIKWQVPLGVTLLGLFVLVSLSFSMYLFLTSRVLSFGTSDSPQDCFDYPYGYLFMFLGAGILAGVLLTRYLVFPILKKEDVP